MAVVQTSIEELEEKRDFHKGAAQSFEALLVDINSVLVQLKDIDSNRGNDGDLTHLSDVFEYEEPLNRLIANLSKKMAGHMRVVDEIEGTRTFVDAEGS